ncbi:MAG: response regulator transcription factor [Gemmatimonadetes bacterium]|nr:response regulator transcription factor [Gemmatimonadota bacterium]
MRTPKIRVLLADDHAIVLEGLRALLEGERDMAVVASTVSEDEVVPLARKHRPDVVVLDLQIGGVRATPVIAELRNLPEPPKVLVLTAYNDAESVRSALDAGADGLSLKTEPPQRTVAAIREVFAGRLVFPQAARRWLAGRETARPGELTPREREVCELVAAGLTNRQIAQRLRLGQNTVKYHVQHLFQKLGVRNRTEAAMKFAASRSRTG